MFSMRNILHPIRSEPSYLIPIVTAIIFLVNHIFFMPLAEESIILTSLDNLQEQVLSTLNEMTQLLISLSTALFGFIGYFAFEKYKSSGKIEKEFRYDFFMSACAAAISIDFGYIFMEKLVELLSNGIFKPYDFILSIPRNCQVVFFFTALFFCGRLIYRNLFKN